MWEECLVAFNVSKSNLATIGHHRACIEFVDTFSCALFLQCQNRPKTWLEPQNPHISPLTEFKTFMRHCWWWITFYPKATFPQTECWKLCNIPSLFPWQMFRRAPFFSATNSEIYREEPFSYDHWIWSPSFFTYSFGRKNAHV